MNLHSQLSLFLKHFQHEIYFSTLFCICNGALKYFRCLQNIQVEKNLTKKPSQIIFSLICLGTYLFFFLHYYSKYFGLIVRFLGKAIMTKQDCIHSGRLRGRQYQGQRCLLPKCLQLITQISERRMYITIKETYHYLHSINTELTDVMK